ncbi:uncharacterized, partial [Tachysurus ichikawai]
MLEVKVFEVAEFEVMALE